MTEVYISAVISAQAHEVWSEVRDFNGLPAWHPLVKHSRIEGGLASDQVGCIRHFELNDGANIREQLLALSDFDYSCTYSILESEMGVENYVATIQFTPITEVQQTFAQWRAEFDCDAQKEAELVRSIGQDVFAADFQALSGKFEK